ncbi:MAG TPA: DUF362 domain-containing protein [Planctomycetota bacterium]|nr:DUF362 domain-containing protein [Planctomycetota bacterium]
MTARQSARAKSTAKAQVYFGSSAVERPSGDASLPAKLRRILERFDLERLCGKARVPIKMHLGGGIGYTTVHPVLVRIVVDALKKAGGKPFVVDGRFDTIASAAQRGYTAETLGCPIVSAGGVYDSHLVTKKVRYRTLRELRIFGAIWDAPCLVNLSHVKGHGDCAYGGACKNIAMGCVNGPTRGALHALEGGIEWDAEACVFCGRCAEACDRGAIHFDKAKRSMWINYHHCRFCRHCIVACPKKALVMRDPAGFRHFQEGMALAAKTVLGSFEPDRVLHINLLTNITLICDCWGMSLPSLVPDIGVMASQDIVAIEAATLDAIQADKFIPGTLFRGWELGEGGHLFEKLFGKDPYGQVRALERRGLGTSRYKLVEVR